MQKRRLLSIAVALSAVCGLLLPSVGMAQADYAIKFTTARKPNPQVPTNSVVTMFVVSPSDRSAPIWIDLNNDGKMQEGEKVKEFDSFQNYPIGSSDLVVYGPVETIYLFRNEITKLDPSGNPTLKDLRISGNKIESMDISKNEEMIALRIYDNEVLKTLKLNKKISELYCYNNKLESLDLSENTALTILSCYKNGMKSLVLPAASKNPAIYRIGCHNNNLRGDVMTSLLRSLPKRTNDARFIIVNKKGEPENNEALKVDVEYAKSQGWSVLNLASEPYEGIEGDGIVLVENTDISVHTDGQNIFIDGAQSGAKVALYDGAGSLIYSGELRYEKDFLPINLSKGLYILSVDDKSVKIML